MYSSEQSVQLVAGPIVEKSSGFFTIGKIATGTFGEGETAYTGLYTDRYGDSASDDGVLEVAFSSGINVISYDFSEGKNSRLDAGTSGSIMASSIGDSQYLGDDQNIVPWDTLKADSAINFAFAMLVDDEAVCIFVINAE